MNTFNSEKTISPVGSLALRFVNELVSVTLALDSYFKIHLNIVLVNNLI